MWWTVSQKKQEMTFEQAVQRLEEIADILSGNNVELDKAMELYKEGVKLADMCNKKLDSVKRKITVIRSGEKEIGEENE